MGWNELDQRGCRDGGGAWERDETSVCSGGGRSGLKKVKDPVSGAQVGPECRGSGGAHRIQGSFWCFVWVAYLDRIKNFDLKSHSTSETFLNRNAVLIVHFQGQGSP